MPRWRGVQQRACRIVELLWGCGRRRGFSRVCQASSAAATLPASRLGEAGSRSTGSSGDGLMAAAAGSISGGTTPGWCAVYAGMASIPPVAAGSSCETACHRSSNCQRSLMMQYVSSDNFSHSWTIHCPGISSEAVEHF